MEGKTGEPARPIEIGWLIETNLIDSAVPHYMTVRLGLFDWTIQSSKAVRCARKEDAERMIPKIAELWPNGVLRITEHQWG